MGTANEEKPAVTLPRTVESIIPAVGPETPEKAQIAVHGAEELYKEIRIENTLQSNGEDVALKPGAHVEVTIEADPHETTPKAKGQT